MRERGSLSESWGCLRTKDTHTNTGPKQNHAKIMKGGGEDVDEGGGSSS